MSAPQPDQPAPAEGAGSRPRLIRLGSVLGVPVFVTPSWLVIVVVTTLSYAGFLKDQIPGTSTADSYALALLFSLALGASVLLHEIGHTVVSRLLGMPVRRIVVFLLGGVSEIEGEARRPRDEFAIAAAGPLVSFLLAVGCWGVSRWPDATSASGVLLLLLAWSNLVIAVFNVLPGLPLDGGRLVQALVWTVSNSRLTGVRIAAWSGRGVAALLALAIVVGNAVLNARQGSDLSALTATVLGFAVAGFLWFGAGQTLRVAELTARTAGLRLGPLIRPSIYLPGQTPVAEAMRQAAAYRAAGIVVIDETGRSRALVREAEVATIEQRRRPWITLAEVSRTLEPGLIIAEDLPGAAVLDAVRATPATEYLIIDRNGVSRGVLAISDLARALGLRHSMN
ncbi:MAG: site-2 protease family protein [Actinomycetota bacterium]|nr:site-2 protease family protein [Actinomycetota bacterium]MDQ2956397.1 site-2 protease family protein [Actinomycetota bacterium]